MAKTLAGLLAVSITALLFAGCGGSSKDSSSAAENETSTTTSLVVETTTTTMAPTTTTTTALPPPTTAFTRPAFFAGNDFQGLANFANARKWSDGLIPSFRPPHTASSIRASIDYLASSESDAPTPENCRSAGRMREWNYREMVYLLEITRDRATFIPVSLARIYFLCGEEMARQVSQLRVDSWNSPGDVYKWTWAEVDAAIAELIPYRTVN